MGRVPVCTHWEQYVKPCSLHKKAYNTNHLGKNILINVILRQEWKVFQFFSEKWMQFPENKKDYKIIWRTKLLVAYFILLYITR